MAIVISMATLAGCARFQGEGDSDTRRVTTLTDDDAEFHSLGESAVIQRSQGHLIRALVILREMEAIRPNDAGTQFALGEVLGSGGQQFDGPAAIQALENYLRLATGGRYMELARKDAYVATRKKAGEYILRLKLGKKLGVEDTMVKRWDGIQLLELVSKSAPEVGPLLPMATPPPDGPVTLHLGGGIEMAFSWIPAGQFAMGSTLGDEDEKPVHVAEITEGFWMGVTEVTQSQWKELMGMSPSFFSGPTLPVERVSWAHAGAFCEKLTAIARKKGLRARLPTEVEWEFACRAGTTGETYNTAALTAWSRQNSKKMTHPVGQKLANDWGLHDMYGNVWEWCQDWYAETAYDADKPKRDSTGAARGSHRVLRGGSWDDTPEDCRSALRMGSNASSCFNNLGFRVVLTPATDPSG